MTTRSPLNKMYINGVPRKHLKTTAFAVHIEYAGYTDNHPASLGSNVFFINSAAHPGTFGYEDVSQTIPVVGTAGDTYSFGGWLMSTCPPQSTQWMYSQNLPIGARYLTVEFLAANGYVTASSTVAFAVDTTEWQNASGVAVATHDYSSIRIKVSAIRCIGVTLVDGLQLYRETCVKRTVPLTHT